MFLHCGLQLKKKQFFNINKLNNSSNKNTQLSGGLLNTTTSSLPFKPQSKNFTFYNIYTLYFIAIIALLGSLINYYKNSKTLLPYSGGPSNSIITKNINNISFQTKNHNLLKNCYSITKSSPSSVKSYFNAHTSSEYEFCVSNLHKKLSSEVIHSFHKPFVEEMLNSSGFVQSEFFKQSSTNIKTVRKYNKSLTNQFLLKNIKKKISK